jgi:hypothetical protein
MLRPFFNDPVARERLASTDIEQWTTATGCKFLIDGGPGGDFRFS